MPAPLIWVATPSSVAMFSWRRFSLLLIGQPHSGRNLRPQRTISSRRSWPRSSSSPWPLSTGLAASWAVRRVYAADHSSWLVIAILTDGSGLFAGTECGGPGAFSPHRRRSSFVLPGQLAGQSREDGQYRNAVGRGRFAAILMVGHLLGGHLRSRAIGRFAHAFVLALPRIENGTGRLDLLSATPPSPPPVLAIIVPAQSGGADVERD